MLLSVEYQKKSQFSCSHSSECQNFDFRDVTPCRSVPVLQENLPRLFSVKIKAVCSSQTKVHTITCQKTINMMGTTVRFVRAEVSAAMLLTM
jgi:hypothetical protein